MDISVENTGDLGRKLKVQVPADQIDERVDGRIREMAQHVRMKGFRPGKVPLQVLRQRFGREVRREVVGQVIQETFQQALGEKQLRPASAPAIDADEGEGGGDLSYTASFEVYPELDRLAIDELSLEKPVASVGEDDVDRMIETLREQRRSWADKESPAEPGDLAFFSLSVTLADGGTFPEGDEAGRAGAVLGHGAFDATFEEALVGRSAGDELDFECTFGEQAREPALAGRTGRVTGRIERVQASSKPEVDAAFIESFGIAEGDLDTFRREVRQNLERELKQALSRRLRQTVIGGLIDSHPELTIPSGLIDQEAENLRQQAQEQLQQMGGDPEKAPPVGSFREQAEKRVRGALLIGEVARHARLEVDMGRVRDRVNEIASTYDEPQMVVQLYYEREDLLSGVQNLVLEEQAVEWVLENATVAERQLTFDEVMHPEQARAAAEA